jgi:hypothetical protein
MFEVSQPHFRISVRPTLPKMGSWSLPGLSKTQSSTLGVKSPHIRLFFMSLKRSWSVDVQDGLAWAIWTSAAQVMGKRRAGSQTGSWPLKVKNRPLSDVCSKSATWCWKALDESYNFGSNLVPIWAWGEKLWTPKVSGVQTGTVSGLHFGSPEKKSHLDVASARSCRKYYKGEGGGFPQVRAVVSKMSPSCPWLVPTPKRVQNEF